MALLPGTLTIGAPATVELVTASFGAYSGVLIPGTLAVFSGLFTGTGGGGAVYPSSGQAFP